MDEQKYRIEIIWGHRLLDDGFTSIPNIVIRNYRKLGIEHGEWGLICTLLTYKHDQRDPYPSQETLAEHMSVSVRQIKKWVDSLVEKKLLLVGQRRNTKSKQFGSAVYNFKPLIQAALKLVGEQPLPEGEPDWDVEYREPSVLEVHPVPSAPEVHSVLVPEVHPAPVPEVHPKITSIKRHIEKNNNSTVAAVQKQIESHLGKSISSLSRLLPGWIETHGEDKLVKLARFIGGTPDKWGNIVGTYRTAVTELWDVSAEVTATSGLRDERYAAFYQLFPDS